MASLLSAARMATLFAGTLPAACSLRAPRIVVLLAAIIGVLPASVQAESELYLLTWAEYFDPEVISEFESEYQAAVKFVYFESDELRDDLLVANSANGFDLVIMSGAGIAAYKRRNWVAQLDENLIPNLKYIDPKWVELFPASVGYAVPYLWGTTGIAYRKDLVSQPFTSWMELFDPLSELKGRITLVKDSRDLFAMALKAQGYSVNTTDSQELKSAATLLLSQKPFVKDYSYITSHSTSELVTGEVLAALAYNGDALSLHDMNPLIQYVVPSEGTNLWVDYLVVLESSQRKKLAMQFLDFINRPEMAARQAEYLRFATPNSAAYKLLPDSVTSNSLIYPSKETLAKSEVYQPLLPVIQKYYNRVFSELLR